MRYLVISFSLLSSISYNSISLAMEQDDDIPFNSSLSPRAIRLSQDLDDKIVPVYDFLRKSGNNASDEQLIAHIAGSSWPSDPNQQNRMVDYVKENSKFNLTHALMPQKPVDQTYLLSLPFQEAYKILKQMTPDIAQMEENIQNHVSFYSVKNDDSIPLYALNHCLEKRNDGLKDRLEKWRISSGYKHFPLAEHGERIVQFSKQYKPLINEIDGLLSNFRTYINALWGQEDKPINLLGKYFKGLSVLDCVERAIENLLLKLSHSSEESISDELTRFLSQDNFVMVILNTAMIIYKEENVKGAIHLETYVLKIAKRFSCDSFKKEWKEDKKFFNKIRELLQENFSIQEDHKN